MSELIGDNPRSSESEQYIPEVLPELEQSSVDKDAITERILDGVISAAERNEALERQYEVSHELKDKDAAQAPSAAPMQSVGTILQQQVARQTTDLHTSDNSLSPLHQTHQAPFADTKLTLSYGRAVRNGFLAAVITSVVLGIATLLIW